MDEEKIMFIDANIFLEVMLENKNSKECEDFLNEVKISKVRAITSDFIIYTSLIQLQNKKKSTEIMKNLY